MCGRFTLDIDARFYPRFNLSSKEILHFEANYNIAPGLESLIITKDLDENHASSAKFGFIPNWAKSADQKYKMINAKAETILEKPAYRIAIKKQRCLIPVTGFYEWRLEADGRKTPIYFHSKTDKYLALAGIFSDWLNPENNTITSTFAIVTTTPDELMKPIHDRMPLILSESYESNWLNNDLNETEISKLLRSENTTKLEAYEVSKLVNLPSNNSARLIEKLK